MKDTRIRHPSHSFEQCSDQIEAGRDQQELKYQVNGRLLNMNLSQTMIQTIHADIPILLFLRCFYSFSYMLARFSKTLKKNGVLSGICIIFLLLNSHPIALASPIKADQFDSLDKRYQKFSQQLYGEIIKHSLLPLQKHSSISELKKNIDVYIESNKPVHAIALIHLNHNTIYNNIDALEVVPLTALLLQHNDWHQARNILDAALDMAGKPAISRLSFEFAKYFMKRKNWQMALQYLRDVINELSVENANYARLMTGTIFQYQKKHRQAIKVYQKIPPSSKHYPIAVLNTAVAYIRQDWWTDAHVLINDTLKSNSTHVSDVMADRLNIVLGYAMLRKKYYRNSREAFRNVSLNSPYTNKSLLGIALSAANQDDFIGALNAIRILKDKKTTDLPVDEAYLLLPYTYGKLKQYLTASSAYTDAIKYYQERIASLNDIINARNNILSIVRIMRHNTSLKIKSNELDYSKKYPESFFHNYTDLAILRNTAEKSKDLLRKYNSLLADYKSTLSKVAMDLVLQRIDYVESYLNQSRYGLARLYDSSLISANQ